MSNEQPEAHWVARELEIGRVDRGITIIAAAELRRLYEVNQALVKALEEYVSIEGKPIVSSDTRHAVFVKARAAISKAKAKGEANE